METTTIAISKEVKEQLNLLGNKGQTYDDLIAKLIEMAERTDFFEGVKKILATEKFVKLNEI